MTTDISINSTHHYLFCIYRITNLLNNKTYIGKHKYLNKEDPLYKYDGSGKLLKRSYEKYGKENFKKEILIQDIESLIEINKLEKEYILKERIQGHGEYNISDGGDGGALVGDSLESMKANLKKYYEGMPDEEKERFREIHREAVNKPGVREKCGRCNIGRHFTMSEEARKKISNSKKGCTFTEEHKRNISLNHADQSGDKNGMFGRIWNDEGRTHISQRTKEAMQNPEVLAKVRKPRVNKENIRKATSNPEYKERHRERYERMRALYKQKVESGEFIGNLNEFQHYMKINNIELPNT